MSTLTVNDPTLCHQFIMPQIEAFLEKHQIFMHQRINIQLNIEYYYESDDTDSYYGNQIKATINKLGEVTFSHKGNADIERINSISVDLYACSLSDALFIMKHRQHLIYQDKWRDFANFLVSENPVSHYNGSVVLNSIKQVCEHHNLLH